MKNSWLNIPNLLSLYRLLTFPLLIWLIITRHADLFAIFLCINLVTDVLDGLIARLFKLETALGAKLDSIADIGSYIAGFWGALVFKANDFGDLIWMLWVFIGSIILYQVISLIKCGRPPSLHLYSTKIGGYLQGGFFFCLFAFSYYECAFLVAMIWGYLSFVEEIAILLILPKMRSNVRGIWWVLREQNSES